MPSRRAPRPIVRFAGALLSAVLVSGCATDPFGAIGQSQFSSAELEDTVFFPQEAYQCGPAALATLLSSAGVPVEPGALTPQLYIPERGGSLQSEMIAAARRYQRLPYEIDTDFSSLLAELDAGRPVLVLQNLGVSFAPAWHYAVVIGYSTTQRELVLRSGTTRRLAMSGRTFLRTWKRGDYWGIVLLEPDGIPPTIDKRRFLRMLAAVEGSGQLELARAAYAAATERWPEEPLAWLGTGNTYFALGDLDAAEKAYRQLLVVQPADIVGMNNLASLLIARSSCSEAAELIATAQLGLDDNSPFNAILEESARELAACHLVDQQ
ncbi:MAG: PA2778 family cysteine peptidase [Gammaproteobacteria bacterium]|nr:PA2778 family cysteine peptidase [Gammaproteobacteria bacterium]MDH4315311.1 PA2778 family cysteine peptidase [Gammaproteobacteria bacterium]MDH5213426.1 PA2778 family cysteine peptidase [Gammaproteobacteria bacterium]MDH5501044.1 PA2778 family cysteine peptidase [Gammaproteobacteria bacterium]